MLVEAITQKGQSQTNEKILYFLSCSPKKKEKQIRGQGKKPLHQHFCNVIKISNLFDLHSKQMLDFYSL